MGGFKKYSKAKFLCQESKPKEVPQEASQCLFLQVLKNINKEQLSGNPEPCPALGRRPV